MKRKNQKRGPRCERKSMEKETKEAEKEQLKFVKEQERGKEELPNM